MKITSKVVRGISVAALLCSLSVQVWAATLQGGYQIAQACCTNIAVSSPKTYAACISGGCITLQPNDEPGDSACLANADKYKCVAPVPVTSS